MMAIFDHKYRSQHALVSALFGPRVELLCGKIKSDHLPRTVRVAVKVTFVASRDDLRVLIDIQRTDVPD